MNTLHTKYPSFNSMTWRTMNPLNKFNPLSLSITKPTIINANNSNSNPIKPIAATNYNGLLTRPILQRTIARPVQLVPYEHPQEQDLNQFYPAYSASLSKRFYLPETLKMQVVEERVRKMEALNKNTLREYQELLSNQLDNELQDYQYMNQQQLMKMSNDSYLSRQNEVKNEISKIRSKLRSNYDYSDSEDSSIEQYDNKPKKKRHYNGRRKKNRSMKNMRDKKDKMIKDKVYLPLIKVSNKVEDEKDNDVELENDLNDNEFKYHCGMDTDLSKLKQEIQMQLKQMEEERTMMEYNYANGFGYGKPNYSRVYAAINQYDNWEREIYEEIAKKHQNIDPIKEEEKEKTIDVKDNKPKGIQIESQVNSNEEDYAKSKAKLTENENKENDNQQNPMTKSQIRRRKKKSLSDKPFMIKL